MNIVRKRRTREHVIADLSVNHVERQALLCGYTVERVRADYGYDLLLTTFDAHGEVETGEVRFQVKATDTLPNLKDGMTIPWKISRSDLARWLNDSTPVILIVYDAQSEIGYWFYVQRYFENIVGFNLFAAPNTVSVHIPKGNVLDPAAIALFSQYRDTVFGRLPKGIHHE